MHEKLAIIYTSWGEPKGIRDRGGFLFFFPQITRFEDQDERYKKELKERHELADYLLEALKKRQ